MNKQGIFLLQLIMVSWNCGLCFDLKCSEGEHLHTPRDPQAGDVCILCKDGTFMSETEHTNRRCHECSKNTTHLEIIITPCNITHDAEIHCVSGYYRRRAQTALEKDSCVECLICESGLPARPCQGYNDTVCCLLQHDAVWTCKGWYECKARPACGAGMYFNTTFDTCLSCPSGTYMQAHHHTTRECLKCATLSGNSSNHAVILQPCTRTSPTVFGCEDFYFRASDSGSLLEEAPCRPCQNCRCEVTQCQILHDAVCAEYSREDEDYSEDTDTREGVDTIKQLKATFNGSLHTCLLDCMTDGFVTLQDTSTQSESSKLNCVLSCFPKFNIFIAFAWVLTISCILLLVRINCVICRDAKTYVAANNHINWYLNFRLFAYVLFVFNVLGVILFILAALLVTRYIEDNGNGAVAIVVCCGVVFMLNMFFWGIKTVLVMKPGGKEKRQE